MIQVLPVKDKEKLISLYKEKGIDLSSFGQAVVATDKDAVLGLCLFEIENSKLTVLYIEPMDDILLADGILRSALHVGVTENVTSAEFGGSLDQALFKKLGFLGKSEKEIRIEKLFESCCSHK